MEDNNKYWEIKLCDTCFVIEKENSTVIPNALKLEQNNVDNSTCLCWYGLVGMLFESK